MSKVLFIFFFPKKILCKENILTISYFVSNIQYKTEFLAEDQSEDVYIATT